MPDSLIKALGMNTVKEFDVKDVLGREIACFVPYNKLYEKLENNRFRKKTMAEINNVLNTPEVVKIKVVGVAKQKTSNESQISRKRRLLFGEGSILETGAIYSHELGDYIKKTIEESDIVKAQKQTENSVLDDVNVGEGSRMNRKFASVDDGPKSKKELKENLLKDLGYREGLRKISIFMNSPVDDEDRVREYLDKFNEGKPSWLQIVLPQQGGYKEYARDIKKGCLFVVLTIGLASLLASLIMVALLEFISVLERVKEIGVLRSIGARKKDVSRLFKSEALIIGFFTGIFGVLVAYMLSIFLNGLV